MAKKIETKARLVQILDAVHKENLGTDDDPVYENSIFLRLKDIETGAQFTCNLTTDTVQALTGLSRQMTSKEMIHFAEALRQRTDPVTLNVPKNAKIVTPKMIRENEDEEQSQETIENERIKEPIDLENVKPAAGKYVDKFSVKKQKKGNI